MALWFVEMMVSWDGGFVKCLDGGSDVILFGSEKRHSDHMIQGAE